MGQADDNTDRESRPNPSAPASEPELRDVAVAIDPPPPGALGIRDLLRLLDVPIATVECDAADRNTGRDAAIPPRRASSVC